MDKTKLATFIKNEMQLNIDSLHISQFAGGYSNLTYLLEINETIKWVLRKPPLDDRIAIDTCVAASLATLPLLLAGDLAGAMHKIHAKPPRPKPPRPADTPTPGTDAPQSHD